VSTLWSCVRFGGPALQIATSARATEPFSIGRLGIGNRDSMEALCYSVSPSPSPAPSAVVSSSTRKAFGTSTSDPTRWWR